MKNLLRNAVYMALTLGFIQAIAQKDPNLQISGCSGSSVLDPANYQPSMSQHRPMAYTHLREADVMWSKRIWRVMDLREKMNQPYYYPEVPTSGRSSLFDLIKCAVVEGRLTAYGNAVLDDEFKVPLQVSEVQGMLIKMDTLYTTNVITGLEEKVPVPKEITSTQVKRFLIKEDWFFDRQKSVMEVRIIGICPVADNYDDQGNLRGYTPLFWIYFPEVRPLLASQLVMLRSHNFSQRPTFDHLFSTRFFSSFITKESNVFDRNINEYKAGIECLLEADKIKEDMMNLEHDLWHF